MIGKHGWLVGVLLFASATAQGAEAPAGLYGKSIIVEWSEDRTVAQLGGEQERARHSNHSLEVYVSTAGHVFDRYSAWVTGGRRGLRGGSNEQVAGGANANRKVRFEGHMLLVENAFRAGGRRIAATFDAAYASCTANVINGLAAGETKSIRRSVISNQLYELRSVKTGAASCQIRSGNVFGGQ